jgi:uncharacterized protein YcbK (DUF882 family)
VKAIGRATAQRRGSLRAALAAALFAATTFQSTPLKARADAPIAPANTPPTAAATTPAAAPPNWIDFHNTHTDEHLRLDFRTADGQFIPEALGKFDLILGDHRSEQHRNMDPQLYVLLVDLAEAAGVEPHYEIISAYRAAETNEKLRSNGGGQAKNSQHIQGKAIDVRLKGVTTERLRDLALALKRGGVGYYRKSDFVHVDTARVRYWEG